MVSGEKNIVSNPSEKSAFMTLLLFFFLGWLGIHRFYVGRWLTGLLMLGTLGLFGIWYVFDFALLVSNEFTDGKGRTVELLKKPGSFKVVVGFVMGLAVVSFFVPAVFGIILAALNPEFKLRSVVEEQRDALRVGDMPAAYSYTAAGYQKNNSIDAFASFVRAHQLDANARVSIMRADIVNDDGKVIAQLTLKDGSIDVITYRFHKENGEWKIISIDIQRPMSNSSNAPKSGDQ